ncbi:lactate utilization protein B [Brevibacterium atlanticum]|uniref:lactate utilization protein B n=1 Tax=Brevibacterium atlanticum TaxID=2697563 RepID=UPI001D195582|nr:lactate utilization protein B [Brevibacterium atlanticum]
MTFLGMPLLRSKHAHSDLPGGQGNIVETEAFPEVSHEHLSNQQLRNNIGHATSTIRSKRAEVVSELDDWEKLRNAGEATKNEVMANLPEYLAQFEEAFTATGGIIHWARDADEANAIVTELIEDNAPVLETGRREVIKVKSMATQEIGLNEHLETQGIDAFETDLAELIVQLGEDKPSHILVPAIHRNRDEIRDIFMKTMPDAGQLTNEPAVLAEAARKHLRHKFLTTKVAISGANFGIAETGTLGVVESEGNGRMCLTLPETLITVMGIEKLLPRFADLEVFLQLLPRSSTGERMNPYTSFWTGRTEGDGPQNVHLVLLDNGRTRALADEHGRTALNCIRCSACMNVCPVYERTGGHAYGSTYPGPIGAILSPLLTGVEDEANGTLPYASSLCGACYDVCPVKINIPEILVHLRAEDVEANHSPVSTQLDAALTGASWMMGDGKRMTAVEKGLPLAHKATRGKQIDALPGIAGAWTSSRDIPALPEKSFRQQWADEEAQRSGTGAQTGDEEGQR